MIDPAVAALLGTVAGLIAGSFLSTLALRWPKGWTLAGRSRCDGCKRGLRAWELVPIVGALLSRGRCAACGARSDRVHVSMEVGCAALGGASLWLSPDLSGATAALAMWVLATLALIDARHFWLPDPLTATLALVGLAAGFAGAEPPLEARLIGGAAGYVSLWVIARGYRMLRGREGLGGGDPKLFGAIGLWLGWEALPIVLLLASAIGLSLMIAVASVRGGVSASTRLPLGPFLAIAAIGVWFVSHSS